MQADGSVEIGMAGFPRANGVSEAGVHLSDVVRLAAGMLAPT